MIARVMRDCLSAPHLAEVRGIMHACDAGHCGSKAPDSYIENCQGATMRSTETASEIALNNILYLTDFSDCAEAALPVATAIAREFGAKIYAMHVLLPDVYTSLAPEFGQVVITGLEQAAGAKNAGDRIKAEWLAARDDH